jgi:hypothetical protein
MHRLLLLIVIAVAGCGAAAFRLTPPAGWNPAQHTEGATIYQHGDGGAIAAGKHCGEAEDVSLDVLTNHLLIGVERRAERSRRSLVVDGRAALRTQLDGAVDGVPVAFDLVVIKKDGCAYDLMLVGARAEVERRRPDFERFVASFAVARP